MSEDEKPQEGQPEDDAEAARPRPAGEWVPPSILQNQGVPIELYKLDGDQVIRGGDDEPVREKHYVRFTNRMVARIEEMFDGLEAEVPIKSYDPVLGSDGEPMIGPAGPVVIEKTVGHEVRRFYGLEAFAQAMATKARGTTFRVLAVALGKSEEALDPAVIPSEHLNYQNAVGLAWSLAQGMDPTEAANVWRDLAAANADARDRLVSELRKTMGEDFAETDASPGPTG